MNDFSDFSFSNDFSMSGFDTAAPGHPDKCTQCSICVVGCPTYQITQDFEQSPMGRIKILRQKAEEVTDVQKKALESCLHCFRCESVCPSQVNYRQLIVDGYERLDLPQKQKTSIKLLKDHVVPGSSKKWLNNLASPLAKGMKPLKPLLSPISASTIDHLAQRQTIRKVGSEKADTVLFAGCLGDSLQGNVVNDAISLLESLDLKIRVDSNSCCGALHRHSGSKPTSLELASTNVIELSDSNIKNIVHISSACSDSMKHYDDWLDSDALPTNDIANVSQKTIDIIDLLHQKDWTPNNAASTVKNVLVHMPCSMAATTRDNLSSLLAKLNKVNISYIDSGPGCCGAGGTHAISHADMAKAALEPIIDQVNSTNAELVVSANIGCRLHIHSGLLSQSSKVQVIHPISFLRYFA